MAANQLLTCSLQTFKILPYKTRFFQLAELTSLFQYWRLLPTINNNKYEKTFDSSQKTMQ